MASRINIVGNDDLAASGNLAILTSGDITTLGTVQTSVGDISLTSTAGAITVNLEVIGHRNVTAHAYGDVTALPTISATTGNVSLTSTNGAIMATNDVIAYANITGLAYGDITTTATVRAATGIVSLTSTNAGITENSVIAQQGNVALTAGNGSILEHGTDAAADIQAININLTAVGGGIGLLANSIEIDSSNPGFGLVTATADQSIFLTEVLGDLNLASVTSRLADVTLVALGGSILDGQNDAASDVTGVNITLTANAGGIGSSTDALEIDSSNPSRGMLNATALQSIYITEVQGDLNVDRVTSAQGDVTLVALAGSILDANNDAAVNVTGVSVFLSGTGGGIGASGNDLEIDSSAPRPGRLFASADQSIYLTEVSGLLYVREAVSTGGDIRLTVPDTAGLGNDLFLVDDGRISAPGGSVLLRSGDNIEAALTSLISAAVGVEIDSDFGDQDSGAGATILLANIIVAPFIILAGGLDDDYIRVTGGGEHYRLYGNAGNDTLIGSGSGDVIDGGPGNDRIWGLGGADTIAGGEGDDAIYGGARG